VTSRQSYTNDVTPGNAQNTDGVGAYTRIFKYTGYLTDDLTLQVLLGRSRTPHPLSLAGYDATKPQVVVDGEGNYPGFTYNNLQDLDGTIGSPTYAEEVKAKRIDIEYRIGSHTVRAGLDSVKMSALHAGQSTAGGRLFTYSSTNDGTYKANGMTNPISQSGALTSNGLYYFGTETISNTISNAYSDQNAQYLEDKFQITKDLMLTGGIRNEQYKNKTNDGQVFLKVKDQITPRVSLAWDALGDSSTKVSTSYGRYAVQLPAGIALRGANGSLNTSQVFSYTGVKADGSPDGRVDLGPAFSQNNEYGQPKDLKSVSGQNLTPNMQDEFTLGLEKAISDTLVGGVRMTYRKLVSSLDDYCDPRALSKWANDRGITDKNGDPFAFNADTGLTNLPFACATFNPGKDNTFLIDYKQDGNYKTVHLTADELGFAKARRTYLAFDFSLEHPLKDGWYGKINYTYAKNKGNTEGQTNSDIGQGDVAATTAWDHPELMVGSYGYLPNDRRHQIKAYGSILVTPEWQFGANVLLASGRPRTCLGNYPSGNDEFDTYVSYGSYYHFCGDKLSARGTAGQLPWDKRLDLNVVYKPDFVPGFGLRADIFNVINTQTVESALERYENSYATGSHRNSYGRVLSYTDPRSIKFTASYDIKF
jgi:hypothetical protein